MSQHTESSGSRISGGCWLFNRCIQQRQLVCYISVALWQQGVCVGCIIRRRKCDKHGNRLCHHSGSLMHTHSSAEGAPKRREIRASISDVRPSSRRDDLLLDLQSTTTAWPIASWDSSREPRAHFTYPCKPGSLDQSY